MTINCIIVDDEPVARDILKTYISDTPTLRLMQVCNNAFEASEALMLHHVDLIFLDINMPKLSGMKFYKSLNKPPYVVFTTAYPEFATEGFEVDAIDYLLKPFPFERFLKAVNKAMDSISKSGNNTQSGGYILLKADKKFYKVGLSEILFIEALGDYVKVYYDKKFIIVHETLQGILEQLPNEEFVRIHKSFAIAVSKIKYLEGNMVKLDELEIPIGKSFKEDFMKMIGKS